MPTVGLGPWRSEQLQDKHWRRAVESLDNPATPAAQRLKTARKILRDGNDLACCMLFCCCRSADPSGLWGVQHPYEPIRGAIRFRALRILGQPSRLQGKDHQEAAQLLPWIAKPRDQVILLRMLQSGQTSQVLPALQAFARIIEDVPTVDEDLIQQLEAHVRDAQLSATVHAALAGVLSRWQGSQAQPLLTKGASHTAHVTRWPYLSALLVRAPDIGRPLAEAHLEALGTHHIHAPDIRAALQASVTHAQGTQPGLRQ